ncbi:MAG: hypothetical protein H6733_06505 [Alphaproteobacteria bacterium]|nr:hypothetical protein [Alphaproteobacteria bacterium]
MSPTLLAWSLLLAPAFGQVMPGAPHPEPPPEEETEAPDDADAPVPGKDVALAEEPEDPAQPHLRYEVSLRGHYLSVPRGLMDVWFTDDDDDGWPLPGQDRPFLHAAAYGIELTVQKKQTLGIFYFEYVQNLMREGYWDDREKEQPYLFVDGDWLDPSKGFGAVVFGANGAYDAPIVHLGQTKGRFALSFVVGGGLGIAALFGSIDQWKVDRTTGTPAYVLAEAGTAPDRQLDLKSPVWPVPDFYLAFKFNIVDRVVLRLEGGLHGGLFYGGTLGGRF